MATTLHGMKLMLFAQGFFLGHQHLTLSPSQDRNSMLTKLTACYYNVDHRRAQVHWTWAREAS